MPTTYVLLWILTAGTPGYSTSNAVVVGAHDFPSKESCHAAAEWLIHTWAKRARSPEGDIMCMPKGETNNGN